MRKIMILAMLIIAIGGIARAERTITLNEVTQVMGRLFFGPSIIVGTETFHAPLLFAANARAVSVDGFSIVVSSKVVLGQLRDTPYTAKESWSILPAALKPIFKDVYNQAIGVDLSQ